MNVIIADDDKVSTKRMVSLLRISGCIYMIRVYENPQEVLKELANQKAGIVFLSVEWTKEKDEQLPEVIKKLHPEVEIVFVSKSNENAVFAFKMDALDYLLKPIQQERLAITLERYKSIINEGFDQVYPSAIINMFGDLEIRNAFNQPLKLNWRTKKVKEVFALMVFHSGQFVRKGTLVEMIWPELDYNDANSLMYTTIYQLRSELRRQNLGMSIISKSGGYKLDLGNIRVDVEEWENKMLHAPELTVETINIHKQLLNSYRGEYLQNLFYPWAESKRNQFANLWFHHAIRVCKLYISIKEYSEALHICRKICYRNPQNSEGYRLQIQIFEELEDFASVKEQYKRLAQLLD